MVFYFSIFINYNICIQFIVLCSYDNKRDVRKQWQLFAALTLVPMTPTKQAPCLSVKAVDGRVGDIFLSYFHI